MIIIDLIATVLHPDVCGAVGPWSITDGETIWSRAEAALIQEKGNAEFRFNGRRLSPEALTEMPSVEFEEGRWQTSKSVVV